MKKVITYGTFDLFHIGHLRALERARALGDHLTVGVSTDAFNREKGEEAVCRFEERMALVAALRCVDATLPEESFEQKAHDIGAHGISVLAAGDDWQGRFDDLASLCSVVYLPGMGHVHTHERMENIRRINARISIQVPCKLEGAPGITGALSGHTSILSVAGACVRLDRPLDAELRAGTSALLTLELPTPTLLPCTIVQGHALEVWLRFIFLPREAREAVTVLLAEHRTDIVGRTD